MRYDYEIWFDGAIEPVNPGGTAAYGVVVKQDGKELWTGCGIIGTGPRMTNNVAEAEALCKALDYLIGRKGTALVMGDSTVIINAIIRGNRHSKKESLYWPYMLKAIDLLTEVRKNMHVYFQWIPREDNEEADRQSRKSYSRSILETYPY